MQEQAPHETPHSALGRSACSSEFKDDAPVLFFEGQRVYDAPDIAALIAMGDIRELLAVAARRRWKLGPWLEPLTESRAHYLEFGHPLQFGCCRDVA